MKFGIPRLHCSRRIAPSLSGKRLGQEERFCGQTQLQDEPIIGAFKVSPRDLLYFAESEGQSLAMNEKLLRGADLVEAPKVDLQRLP